MPEETADESSHPTAELTTDCPTSLVGSEPATLPDSVEDSSPEPTGTRHPPSRTSHPAMGTAADRPLSVLPPGYPYPPPGYPTAPWTREG